MATGVKFPRFPELKSVKGISFTRRHIDRLEANHKFPKRVRLGEHSVAWVESEIDAFIEAAMAARPSFPSAVVERGRRRRWSV
jgi:prophage regulatory protein